MIIRLKEIKSMNEKDRQEKLKDLKIELLKARAGKTKVRAGEIKKTIARIITLGGKK
jgi:ribosomal protein L29